MPVKSEPMFKFIDAHAAPPEGLRPSGVRSAKQARSQQKHHALLEAGRRLLESQDLASLSVAQLTRGAGMAVGSFYSRFDDKNAWFAELLRTTGEAVLADTQALLASRRWTQASPQRKVALIVQHIVAVHREHRGIFRAALGDTARAARFGVPLHAYGRRLADEVGAALDEQMRRVPRAQRRLRVGIALQLVYGTLVNAVLRDPGPIVLADPRMEKELTRVYLGVLRLD
jgi:AcrR family transcriptional regulator